MTRLLIDGNSLLNAALLRGTDHDQGRIVTDAQGKQVQVNSAQYGVDNFFDKLEKDLDHFSLAPRQVVVVWDGRNSKLRRRTFLPTYKEGRDKVPEVSAELNIARDKVSDMLYHLGATTIVQDGMEADDVLGYLTENLRTQRNVVVTADGDLSVLVDDNTDVWRLGEMSKNPFGGFPHKYITVYKALVGDTSDKIPGAKGFGDAAFVDLVRIFGLDGLDMLVELIENDQLHRLKEDLVDFPKLKLIIDNKDMVATSWRCARLHVEDVNTLNRPMHIRAGMVGQWAELDDSLKAHNLKRFYGTKTLVTAANYARAYAQFSKVVHESPFVALDIETSSSDESDEWIARVNAASDKARGNRIDVLGHELTGMSLTFGDNTQHTVYMAVDHADTDNITVDQCRQMVELIPQSLHTVIQNRQFEFSVLYRTWGDKWLDNGWHGFVPNALDTKVGASYTDENMPKGLKDRSKHHLNYTQQTYEQTTTKSGPVGTLPAGGEQKKVYQKKVVDAVYETVTTGEDLEDVEVSPAVFEEWEDRAYKMRELTGREVLGYGADDTICTAALHTHYQLTMEMENTWQVYLDVETLPEYLTSLAFVQGIPVSLETLRELESADDVKYEQAWGVLRLFLMKHGWEGTTCPVFTEMSPAAVKEAVAMLLDTDEVQFATKKRKLEGMAFDLRAQFPDSEDANLVATIVERGEVGTLNALVKENFTGDPKINFSSPKQMQNLFYRVIGLTPRIINKLTDKQREDEVMRSAFKKFRKAKDDPTVAYTEAEHLALVSKASTDDDAVATALAMDELTGEQRAALEAYQTVRSIGTLRSLFYKPYKVLTHWRDGRVHPSLNQAEAATRRHSASAPNVQQLVKGPGGFRETILPHAEDCVVVSLDESSQELRLGAELSGDAAMISCFVGDNLRDMHHLTAVSAAPLVWGTDVTYDEFVAMLESKDPAVKAKAKALRAQAKTTNFATAYGAMAPKIAISLLTDEATAQAFIDAKDAAFSRLPKWSAEVQEAASQTGYALTMLGARRHLAEGMRAENKWDRAKAERQASNFVIQSSAGEMIRLAMASMWRRGLFTGKYRARFYAPVHDECVVSVHKDDLIPLLREMHPCMIQQYASMKIPLESSISIGLTFGTQVELGTIVDEVRIQAALDELFGGAK